MSEDKEGQEVNIQKQLSRLIWRAGLKPKSTPEERRESWAERRRDCMSLAGKMLRLMEEEGLSITPNANGKPAGKKTAAE